MYSLALFALEVGDTVNLENVSIGQKVMVLEVEEGAASLSKSPL